MCVCVSLRLSVCIVSLRLSACLYLVSKTISYLPVVLLMYCTAWSPLQVCDMYLKYKLPLFVMPPAGVFYAALLAPDPVAVDRLCHIMLK